MNSLEFTAKIEHGVIHLPKEFEDYENAVARVTVTLETAENEKAKKDKLFAVLEKMQQANMFQDIENPVEWQKKLRDEWE
ncbi:MAG: hypothetical protein LH472_11800 [Pyrinomonadaceae bacterium]|nr:hypothetical protein [Pyrinomonadaceae bacterium]